MTTIGAPNHGVMEGKGAYNRHATLQAGGIGLALSRLERAANDLEPGSDSNPVVIADYGSSQGKNSLVPMRAAIAQLRSRLDPERAVFVFHVDQPSNDFNTLFEVLDADANRYTLGQTNVFPCAIGRSFYEQVLPANSVHLGWASYAAVWLSRIPGPITGHFVALYSTGAERGAFERQAARDWEAFLALRATELRRGGRLVVVLPGAKEDGVNGLEGLMDHANAALAEMVEEHAIRAEERGRMAIGAFPRRECELLAPFRGQGEFKGLEIECCELFLHPDPAWADYERDGNEEALATKQSRFFRATFAPSLACGLKDATVETSSVFAGQLEKVLQRRLARQPLPVHSFVQIMVFAKA